MNAVVDPLVNGLERDAIFGTLYPQLRRIAHGQLRRHEPITLLDTTGLVHEVWLRLAANHGLPLDDQGRFLGYASRVMRFVVIDFVRQRHAQRRGGGHLHVTLDTGTAESATLHDEQLLRLNEAIDALTQVDAKLVQVIEMRCFGGLSEIEIAAAMNITERTVRRHWQRARALLHAAMS
jgi:RNA polymerase sigma factor (TIGR02999 family)